MKEWKGFLMGVAMIVVYSAFIVWLSTVIW